MNSPVGEEIDGLKPDLGLGTTSYRPVRESERSGAAVMVMGAVTRLHSVIQTQRYK